MYKRLRSKNDWIFTPNVKMCLAKNIISYFIYALSSQQIIRFVLNFFLCVRIFRSYQFGIMYKRYKCGCRFYA